MGCGNRPYVWALLCDVGIDYGPTDGGPAFLALPRALMQLARARSERLMLAPSRSFCPTFIVSDARSEPAGSQGASSVHAQDVFAQLNLRLN